MSKFHLTAIALDDEISSLEILKQHAKKTGFILLKETFSSPSIALAYLQNHPVDVIFLDIEMPDINGIELAKMIDNRKTKIILVTAYDRYALSGYEIQATDYLVKPVNYDRFLKACMRVQGIVAKQEEDHSDFIFVKDGYQLRKLITEDILYIKSDANWLNIHTAEDRVITRMTLSRIQESLPSSQFFRVHKSYIVNLKQVERVDQQFVYLHQESIPISSAHRTAFLKAVNGFLMN